MNIRTNEDLDLRTTGNNKGTYYVFDLSIGRVVTRMRDTWLPMTGNLLHQIQTVSKIQEVETVLVFQDRYGRMTDNGELNKNKNDSNYNPLNSETDK